MFVEYDEITAQCIVKRVHCAMPRNNYKNRRVKFREMFKWLRSFSENAPQTSGNFLEGGVDESELKDG